METRKIEARKIDVRIWIEPVEGWVGGISRVEPITPIAGWVKRVKPTTNVAHKSNYDDCAVVIKDEDSTEGVEIDDWVKAGVADNRWPLKYR